MSRTAECGNGFPEMQAKGICVFPIATPASLVWFIHMQHSTLQPLHNSCLCCQWSSVHGKSLQISDALKRTPFLNSQTSSRWDTESLSANIIQENESIYFIYHLNIRRGSLGGHWHFLESLLKLSDAHWVLVLPSYRQDSTVRMKDHFNSGQFPSGYFAWCRVIDWKSNMS